MRPATQWSPGVLGLQSGPASIVPNIEEATAGATAFLRTHGRPCPVGRELKGVGGVEYEFALKARLMAGMAGAEAEYVLLGRTAVGDGRDRREILFGMEGEISNPERVEERLRLATRSIVRRHVPTIERVARALRRRKMLTISDLDRLVICRARTLRPDEVEYLAIVRAVDDAPNARLLRG